MPTLKKLSELKAREFEEFEREHWPTVQAMNELGPVLLSSGRVRAAAKAGWFTDLTAEGVDEMTAKEVIKLAQAVDDLYMEGIRIDPKK